MIRLGCRDDLVTDDTGLVFRYDNKEDLKRAVLKMCDVEYYNKLRKGVSKLDFDSRARHQVEVFLD